MISAKEETDAEGEREREEMWWVVGTTWIVTRGASKLLVYHLIWHLIWCAE